MRNTLRLVWLLVFSVGIFMVVSIFEGIPACPFILWGDRVTWKVLAEYCWSPTTTWSGSFLVLQLVLRLFGSLQKR